MELSDLHIFRTVVQAGGVVKAAGRLHRVPSNVTARIRKLEEGLGVTLFLREGRGLRLAPAGQRLLTYADRLLELAAEAREAVLEGSLQGSFRLGAMESTAAVRLPGPLSEFHQRNPGVILDLRIGPTRPLAAQVLAGELDAALVAEPVADPRLEKLPLFEEELVIVAEAGCPPIGAPHDIANRALLTCESGCAYRQRLEAWFEREGVVPRSLLEITSYHAMLGCVAGGMGVSLLPRWLLSISAERQRLSVHTLSPREEWTAQTVLIWRREGPLAKIQALAEVLEELSA